MIAAYAFLAAFTLQILAISVLVPAWFVRYVRVQAARLPGERLAQLYPGVDLERAQKRFLTQYRVLNTGTAVLGLLLLGWLFNYTQRPDWDDGPVEALLTAYFLVAQVLPVGLIAWVGVQFNRKHKRPLPDAKRTATLQRRGLFDFISPFVVGLAVLSYLLFAAFVLYLREHPFQGFAGLINLGGITLIYIVQAIFVYAMVYGGHKNPLETYAARLRTIGLAVKSSIYSCIVIVLYLALNLLLGMLDLQRWEPFALSLFFVSTGLLASMGFASPPREPEPDGGAVPG